MHEVISQTLFSSYNDTDSNQTLRFNRVMSRMSMTTNHKDDEKYNGRRHKLDGANHHKDSQARRK